METELHACHAWPTCISEKEQGACVHVCVCGGGRFIALKKRRADLLGRPRWVRQARWLRPGIRPGLEAALALAGRTLLGPTETTI